MRLILFTSIAQIMDIVLLVSYLMPSPRVVSRFNMFRIHKMRVITFLLYTLMTWVASLEVFSLFGRCKLKEVGSFAYYSFFSSR